MKFKKNSHVPTAAAATQLRSGQGHPFGSLKSYIPLGGTEHRLYQSMREALPVLDAAISKLVRLTGGFTVECTQKKAELAEFLRTDYPEEALGILTHTADGGCTSLRANCMS